MEQRIDEIREEEKKLAEEKNQNRHENAESERHRQTLRVAIVSAILVAGGIIWGIVYNLWIYPPKYDLSKSSLHFSKHFDNWIKQEKRANRDINIYAHGAEFVIHLVVRNIHRGEGDISKPLLVVTAKNNKKEFVLKSVTSYVTSKKEGENITSFTTVDLGRTIHVGPYGFVDDYFEYFTFKTDDEKEKNEMVGFLKKNKDNLIFKIRGEPYNDVPISLIEGS